jgi:DNA-binding transcriptional regulator YiaG
VKINHALLFFDNPVACEQKTVAEEKLMDLKSLGNVLEMVEAAKKDPDDKKLFRKVIRSARDAGLSRTELSRILRVSRATIDRWGSGESAPHPLGRPSVYENIEAIIESIINLS